MLGAPLKDQIMNKFVVIMAIAIYSCTANAQYTKISIKGVEIGLSKSGVADITGTNRSFVRGFEVAGVSGDLALGYGMNGLNLAMFVFSSRNFLSVKEAYAEKYNEMKCTDSEVQNAMGAKFEQTVCVYKNNQGILELVKYMDLNQSSLKMKSIEKIDEESRVAKDKKKDI